MVICNSVEADFRIFENFSVVSMWTEQMYDLAAHGEAVCTRVSKFGFQMMQHIQFEGQSQQK